MARSRGTGLTRKGPHGEGTEKAWPLLLSASSHPLGDSDPTLQVMYDESKYMRVRRV